MNPVNKPGDFLNKRVPVEVELPDSRVDVKAAGYRVTIDITLDDRPIFLSAQELFTNAAHNAWIKDLSAQNYVEPSQIGTSIEGRPIYMMRTDATTTAPKTVMLVGRQHPPDVTGA